MRNREDPIRDYIHGIFKICQNHNVSLIMNGMINNKAHFLQIREEMKLSDQIGGMIADCAERNLSVFKDGEPLPWYETCKEYIEIAKKFENNLGNTKYMLTRLVPGKSKFFQLFAKCKKIEEIDYVLTKIGPQGELLEDPTPYLQEQRNIEALAKKKTNDLKSQKNQEKKRKEPNEKYDTINKKVKI